MTTESLWRAVQLPRFADGDIPNEVDTVVIGAGITGLTTAYLLKQAGKRVAVFDRERIGSGETGNTSAHLTYVTDLRLPPLVDRFGENVARLVWRAGAAAIDLIERNVDDLAIDCEFRRTSGFLCAHFENAKATDSQTCSRKLSWRRGWASMSIISTTVRSTAFRQSSLRTKHCFIR